MFLSCVREFFTSPACWVEDLMNRTLGLSPQSQILGELAFHVANISCLRQNSAMTGGWRTRFFVLNWCRNTIWSIIWGLNTQQQNFMNRCNIEGFYQMTGQLSNDSPTSWKRFDRGRFACVCAWCSGRPGVNILTTDKGNSPPTRYCWPRIPRSCLGGQVQERLVW